MVQHGRLWTHFFTFLFLVSTSPRALLLTKFSRLNQNILFQTRLQRRPAKMSSQSVSKAKTKKRPATHFRSLSASEYVLKLYGHFTPVHNISELLVISEISRLGQHIRDATKCPTRIFPRTSKLM